MIKIWEDTSSTQTRVTPLQLSQGRATKHMKQRGSLAVSVSSGQIQQLLKRKMKQATSIGWLHHRFFNKFPGMERKLERESSKACSGN